MFKLSVITLEKVVFEDDVISVIVPGGDGYFEVLTDHAPIISSIQPGKLVIKDKNSKKSIYAVSGGFFEMVKNKATLLADAIEAEADIDITRAEAALKRAKERIDSQAKDIDMRRAKQDLRRAENRIKVYHEYKARYAHSADFLR